MNEQITKIKWYRKYALMYKQHIISQSIIEIVRLIDAISNKEEYIKYKFPYTSDLIDLQARVVFKTGL